MIPLPLRAVSAACALAAYACTSASPATLRVVATPLPAATPVTTVAPQPKPAPVRTTPSVVQVRYRVDVRVGDAAGFGDVLAAVLRDPRGWSAAGFDVREASDAPFVVVLAEGAEVDELCRPYDTGGEFSCQNGPVVALNADRWRRGVAHWPDGLDSYRTMLLNHEMGHLLGQRHRPCPAPGRLAPVMSQQSGGLGGCRANAWPLSDEIAAAARHDLKLAPAYGE